MGREKPINPAQEYQRYFGTAIFGPLSQHVSEIAQPSADERVLDVACGTGILTRQVANVGRSERVVGLDVNPAMIEVARSLATPGEAAIEWKVGDGTDMDLPDASFDLVLCQQGLQFFSDRNAGAAEMRRVLDDRGRVVIACWQSPDRHPLFAALADAEEPHLKELGVEVTRDELEAPFSLDQQELRSLLESAGFDRVEISEASIEARFPDADRFIDRMESAYAAVIPQFAEDPAAFQAYLAKISEETQAVVGEYRSGDYVVTPMHTNIAVAKP